MLMEGLLGGQAPGRRHPEGRPHRGSSRSVFYAVGGGWRALAKAHIERRRSGQVVHGYTLSRSVAAILPGRFPALAARPRRSRRRPAAGANLAGGRDGHGPGAEAPRARKGGVFRAGLARRPDLFAARHGGAISRSSARGRAAHRTAAGAGAGFRSGAGVLDGRSLSEGAARGGAPQGGGLCAFGYRLERRPRPEEPEEAPAPAAISVHRR